MNERIESETNKTLKSTLLALIALLISWIGILYTKEDIQSLQFIIWAVIFLIMLCVILYKHYKQNKQ